MKAIYKGKLYTISGDCNNMVDLIDDVEAEGKSKTISVLWGDPSLILDPTDDQINNILPDEDIEYPTSLADEGINITQDERILPDGRVIDIEGQDWRTCPQCGGYADMTTHVGAACRSFVPDDGSDGFELPDGTPTSLGSVNLDQLIGCNVHGRLTCILALLDAGDLPTVRLELERLLKFFPNPVDKP
jgi:hypothetical protein